MPIIHLVGPNAVGKTTAVRRWAARYGKLVTPISLDLMRKETGNGDAKRQWLVERSNDKVIVTESVYTNQIVQIRDKTQLRVVSCDQGGKGAVLVNGEWIQDPDWKGDQTEKERKVKELRGLAAVSVCESARTTTTTTFALPDEPVIVVTCPGPVLGKHLRARCEAKGKRFRDDYWDSWKLDYESSRRYLNYANKNLQVGQWKHFVIEDQARDWPVVDEYFGSLFRRIHNRLVRARR